MKELINSYLKFKAQLDSAEKSYPIEDPLVEGITTKVDSSLQLLLKKLDITEEMFMYFLDSCKKAKCIATCVIEKTKSYHLTKEKEEKNTKEEKVIKKSSQTIFTKNNLK